MTYGPASLSFDFVKEGVTGGAGELFVSSDVNTGTSSVSYKVTPADQEMTYLSLTVEKEYMDGFGSEEEFFKDDFEFLSSMAASAGMNLYTFLEKEVVKIGETDFEYRELKTDTEYYMYAYGLTLMGVKTTAIYREEFRTAAPGSSGCVITLTPEVSGNSVTVRAEPSDPDQAYYAGVMEEDDFYKFYGGAWPGAAEVFIYDEVFVRQMSGMTKEQIFNELSYVGEKTLEFPDLNAEENYFVFACAVDGDMNVVGQVTVEDFTTGAVERSDNVIEFRPDVIGVNYAEIAQALDRSILKIEAAVLNALEMTPPELSADIFKTGIYLAGGGSLLRGLDKRIAAKTKLPVHLAEDPLRAVARGTGIALKNFDKFTFLIR